MNSPVISYAEVTMYGALDPDGETYQKCRITMLGKPADATLYQKAINSPNWYQIDQLRQATVTENADGSITIVGVSQTLVNDVGLDPADSMTRWEVRPKGCTTCN